MRRADPFLKHFETFRSILERSKQAPAKPLTTAPPAASPTPATGRRRTRPS
jgi:hypothetical protein